MSTYCKTLILPCWWSWEAAGVITTVLAILVALFQEKFWKWWNKPKPQLVIHHRRDMPPETFISSDPGVAAGSIRSIVTLAVQNSGGPIHDAKVFWVASEYEQRRDKTITKERVFPEMIFEWTVRKENSLESKSVHLYGEESFDFFRSVQEKSQLWQPGLIFKNSEKEGPFKEWANDPPNTSRNPNYEITVYLQIRGSNYVSDYWPIWMRCETGTAGGWTMTPKPPITAKEYLKRFPNTTKTFFKETSERLMPKDSK